MASISLRNRAVGAVEITAANDVQRLYTTDFGESRGKHFNAAWLVAMAQESTFW
jgi:hypothetical protein